MKSTQEATSSTLDKLSETFVLIYFVGALATGFAWPMILFFGLYFIKGYCQ